MNEVLEKIISESAQINWNDGRSIEHRSICYPVQSDSKRYPVIKSYTLCTGPLSDFIIHENDLVIVDSGVKSYMRHDTLNHFSLTYLEPDEASLKIVGSANKLVERFRGGNYRRVVAIGGGLILNVSSYIAEQLGIGLALFPTTIIAMSDACIGGKVRINEIKDNLFVKHSYRSTYEPDQIVIDPQFLVQLTDEQIRVGLAEIIKHAVYQSPALLEYLLSKDFKPFERREDLLRAILWTADLKRVCSDVDPEETELGARRIIKAAHHISDKIEEESGFTIAHGEAVEKAMLIDLADENEKLTKLHQLYEKLGIEKC